MSDTYRTIVKVDVTERNDITQCHSNAITICQTSAIEVTVKNPRFDIKGMHEIKTIMGVRDR